MRAAASELLEAFAHSNLEVIARRCADDLVLWGTDEGESWVGKQEVLESFAGAFALGVRWLGEPVEGESWVAGFAEFALDDGSRVPVRVTMVFRNDLLAHAHYSIGLKAPPRESPGA